MVSEKETNEQLSLELREAHKAKRGGANQEGCKGHENPNAKSFHRKGLQGQKRLGSGCSKWRLILSPK